MNADRDWMERYLQDDPVAFASIYDAYSDAVYGYLTKRVRATEERDDLFQKIWMKFHRSRELWSPEYPLLQWLFVISRSVLIDRKRELRRTALDRADHPGDALEGVLGGYEEEHLDEPERETEAIVDRLGETGLTPDQIEVVRRRVIDEEEYEKIADRLGKTPTNIRKIYSRAIEKLKTFR